MNSNNESWPSGLSVKEIFGWCLLFAGFVVRGCYGDTLTLHDRGRIGILGVG